MIALICLFRDVVFCFLALSIVFCSKELMYQQVLRRFAHFNAIQLSNPAPLFELFILALKEENANSECENDDFNEKVAEVTWCPL